MKQIYIFLFTIVFASSAVFGQTGNAVPKNTQPVKFDKEIELAKRVLDAHGGEKLRAMRSLVVKGTVDVTTSAIAQAIPATFITVFAGEKYRIEIANPFQPIKQVYDGVRTSTSIQGGFTLPPINRLGFPILPRLGEQGFVITQLSEGKKKRGFRMTSPEGFYTDFYIDEKTNLIKGYDSSYNIAGRSVTTSVAIEKFRTVEGITVPDRYNQRFDTEQVTVYASFKAKEISVNTAVADEIFALGN